MPVIYEIKPKNKPSTMSSLVDLRNAFDKIISNTAKSDFLKKCAAEIFLQKEHHRILVHIPGVYLFDSEVGVIALRYMVQYLTDLKLNENYYISKTKNSNKSFEPSEIENMGLNQVIIQPEFTIVLTLKNNTTVLYNDNNWIYLQVDKISNQIKNTFKDYELKIYKTYDYNNKHYNLHFINISLPSGNKNFQLLKFKGDYVQPAIKFLKLDNEFEIVGFNEAEYQKSFLMSMESPINPSEITPPKLAPEDQLLYGFGSDDNFSDIQEKKEERQNIAKSDSTPPFKLSEMSISTPIRTNINMHSELMVDIFKTIGNQKEKYKIFIESMNNQLYSQALRRLCTDSSPLNKGLAEILYSYEHSIKLDPNELAGKDKPRAAIHYAAQHNKELYLFLIDKGANPALKADGKSAREIYEENFGKQLEVKKNI